MWPAAPLLATVPEYSHVGASGPAPTITAPESAAAEAYHFALTSLGFALDEIGGRSVVVTSTGRGQGKTSTALNVALVAANDGRKALLIDADGRTRGLTNLSGYRSAQGLANLVDGDDPHRLTHFLMLGGEAPVPLIPAGMQEQAETSGYFRSHAFRTTFPKLIVEHDLVLIDTPPVLSAAETSEIARLADGAILVVVPGTPLRQLAEAKERLTMTGKPILGYVFNRSS